MSTRTRATVLQAGQRVVQRGFLGLGDGQVVRPVSATARERAGGA